MAGKGKICTWNDVTTWSFKGLSNIPSANQLELVPYILAGVGMV